MHIYDMTASIFYAIESSMFELSHPPLQILSNLVCTLETQLCIRNWQLSRTIWALLPSPRYYLQYPRRDMCVRGTCSDPEVLRYSGAGGTRAYLANSPLNRGTSCTASLENQSLLQWELQSNNRKGLRGNGRDGKLQEQGPGQVPFQGTHRQVQVFLKLGKKKMNQVFSSR